MRIKPSPDLGFWILAAVILLGAAGALTLAWPHLVTAAHRQSARFVDQAKHAGRGEAETNYRLATWLDPANQAAFAGLAAAQTSRGQAEAALASLDHAGEGSEVSRLRVRALIEAGRYNEAANLAAGLAESDPLLAILALATANRSTDPALMARLGSPEALQRVSHAQAGQVPLAAELYATGLLKSSSALLLKQPQTYERDLLLARVHYDRHTAADLAQATNYLTTAVIANPAGLEARQLLVKVYQDQGKVAEAAKQAALVTKLESGRP